MISMSIL